MLWFRVRVYARHFVLVAHLARPFLNHLDVVKLSDIRLRLSESDTSHIPSQFMVSSEGSTCRHTSECRAEVNTDDHSSILRWCRSL